MKNTPLIKSCISSSRRMAPLAGSIALLAVAGWLMLWPSSATTQSSVMRSALKPLAFEPAIPVQTQTAFYLHGTGPVDNPPTVFLNPTAPTATAEKFKDSASINRNGGNPWKEVGTWPATATMTNGSLTSLSDLHVWLGLKNSDDQGTYFDLRVEAYKNNALVASGQSLCITGVTRNPTAAKEVVLGFDPFSPASFNGASDVLKLKVLTRVGSTAAGGSCGGHNNAVGLRLYFDAVARASRFNATIATGDITPPSLTVAQPVDGAITSATQIDVTGTYSDQSPTTITVNGVAATLQGNNFTATVPLVEGQNPLLVVATDAAGNHTDVSRTVVRDTTPPGLSVETPADFSYTQASTIQIGGTFTGATSITVNGVAPTVNGNGFSATVPLPNEGVNTIIVHAADAAGNQSDLFHTVYRDTTPPAISLTNPVEGAIANVLLTSGSVTDASPVTVTVDGVQRPIEDGFFERQSNAIEGARQVVVIATDAAGNHSQVVRSVTIDKTAPIFSNITPAEGTVANSPATISGHVTDATAVTVKVNDIAAVVGASGDFSAANVSLVEGENQLLITAIDAASNQNDFSFILIGQDRTGPSAPVLFPVTSPTRLTTGVVQGRSEPGSQVIVSGGAQPVTADAAFGSGLFTVSVDLSVGANTLNIVARDAAGNDSAASQISINSDPTMALPPAGEPAQINISTGNAQKGLVNTALPRPLIVIVTDQTGSPVANVTARFTVQAGGGQLTGGTNNLIDVNTDAQGYARAGYISGPDAGLQEIRVDFPGNLMTPAVFLADALAPEGVQTTVSGSVLDQNLRALPNVLVRIAGQQTRTGVDGRFTVTNVPSGPNQLIELIGRDQIQLPGRWPNISYDMDVLPGIDNKTGRPFFLPRVNGGISLPLDQNNVVTQDTTFELPVLAGELPITVTAKAGTHVIFPPDVTDKRLSVTRIATNRVPMTLEDGRATNLYISVQPSGAVFETPLETTFPNLDHLAANSEVLLMSFDHDTGRYVQVGTGHVTADGRGVKSDPGNGIHVGAWHAIPPPKPQPEVTVQSFIQIEGNPAFEGKQITQVDAWIEGTRAVAAPNPTKSAPIGSATASRIGLIATLPLAEGEVRSAHVESTVIAEKKLQIKFDSYDKRFAPGAERFSFKYTITAPDATPAQAAKLEIFKDGDLSNPIYVDSALVLTASKLDYTQGGTPGWDGQMNQGADNGKYIEPKNGPFTVRLSVATKPDYSDVVKEEKTTKVEIDSMDMTPDGDFKVFKSNLVAIEVDSPVEVTVKLKNKSGNGVVTPIPLHIKWSFDDPDDTASDNIIDPNLGVGDDNIEVRFGGKRADDPSVAGHAPGKIMWKTVSGFTATVSSDGQTVESDLATSGADQGKTKLNFSTSAIAGDNYHLTAKYFKDDNTTVVKDKKSGKWSVWKRLNFQNVYRMNGGADVNSAASRNNVLPAFNGDGYTDYILGRVVNLNNAPPQTRVFIAELLLPLPIELPTPGEPQQTTNNRAQAWFDRNRANINTQHRNFIALIGAPTFSVIGAKYYHPKYDSNPVTGNVGDPANPGIVDYYPPGTLINADGNSVDPDGEWSPGVQGAEIDEVAFIFLNIANADRRAIVGRHEVGHASDHIRFGLGDGNNGDHASSALMHRTADQAAMPPNGNPNFSPTSIRRLRGVRP